MQDRRSGSCLHRAHEHMFAVMPTKGEFVDTTGVPMPEPDARAPAPPEPGPAEVLSGGCPGTSRRSRHCPPDPRTRNPGCQPVTGRTARVAAVERGTTATRSVSGAAAVMGQRQGPTRTHGTHLLARTRRDRGGS